MTVPHNSLTRCCGWHLRILSAEKYFTVECGNAAREGALGYDLGAPFVSGLHNLFRRGPRNALSNVFRANNVRPYGYAPANLFDAVRRSRRTLIIWQHISCRAAQGELPEGQEKPHRGAPPCNPSAHCFTAGSISIFYSPLLLRIRKKAPLSRCFSHFFRRTYP